jgi:hypothetical protein
MLVREEIPVSAPQTQETRAPEGSPWPIVAAGAAGLLTVLALASRRPSAAWSTPCQIPSW